MTAFGQILKTLCDHVRDSPRTTPSAPSTLEMVPIYPEITKYGKETET